MNVDWHAVVNFTLWLGLILILGYTPVTGIKGI
jgi:hypothetical protein